MLMATEYTYTQLVDQAHYRDHLGLPIKIHPKREYEAPQRGDKDKPLTIGSGTRVIACVRSDGYFSDITGYVLGAVIDINEFGPHDTQFIVEILEASQPHLDKHIGRLAAFEIGWSDYMMPHGIVDVGKANWAKYVKRGE